MSYRPRVSPLHATRTACACAYCLALALAALLLQNPLSLAALTLAVLGAGAAARVGRELGRALLLALGLGVAIAAINALVVRDGLTVIARLGNLPLLGHTDITLEATAYGGVLALRAAALILCGALYTAAVDPDGVLRLFRRVSFHSALTATLATRMVPLLARDARRLSDAQRCRPGAAASAPALMRAVCSGMLDRALDVAAALEVRGYGAIRRPPAARQPVSGQDLAFGVAALAMLAVSILIRAAGVAAFHAYPAIRTSGAGAALASDVVLAALALVPFAFRRGIEP